MSSLIIHDPLAARIREVSEQENAPPEELLKRLIELHYPLPRPASSLTDADIEIPEDVPETEKEAYRHAVRQLRPKLYRIARRYWAKIGDKDKLALSDEELDKHFWLIDHEGIPRFKSEKAYIILPADPMEAFFGLFDGSDIENDSETKS